MNKLFIILTVIIFICCMLSGCSDTYEMYGGSFNDQTHEWISPEGVHYWRLGNSLAPRYDSNGELVIDK